jgi:RNA polymerase sigma-70 factor, ECF subfamily
MLFKKKPKTESEMILLAKKNPKYFSFLYEANFERVFRFVFKRMNGNADETAELVQLTLLKAMGAIGKYEDRGIPFSTWLIRIAQNEINQFFRRLKKEYVVDVSSDQLYFLADELDFSQKDTDDLLEKLLQKMNDLPDDKKDLIELRFFSGLSFKEIADIYEITEPNAKMRVYRILEKLKEELEK